MVPEFRIISTGLARERVSAEDPADVLQDVLKDLKANVDCLGLNYDVMLAGGVLCGYIVTTKATTTTQVPPPPRRTTTTTTTQVPPPLRFQVDSTWRQGKSIRLKLRG